MDKTQLRTQKITFWWRWWDEAEHKSTPEKRLAFYDALMRYIFRGQVPVDPCDKEDADGVDYAAYDATHYFDVVDSLVEHGDARPRGGQPGNKNAAKKTNKKRIKNESENEWANENENEKTNPLRMKNEEGRMKNEEEVNEEDIISSIHKREIPIETVLMIARTTGVPEDFARRFHADMMRQGWQYQMKTQEGTRMANITKRNVAAIMGRFYNYAKSVEERNQPTGGASRTATNQPKGVILHQEGYVAPF